MWSLFIYYNNLQFPQQKNSIFFDFHCVLCLTTTKICVVFLFYFGKSRTDIGKQKKKYPNMMMMKITLIWWKQVPIALLNVPKENYEIIINDGFHFWYIEERNEKVSCWILLHLQFVNATNGCERPSVGEIGQHKRQQRTLKVYLLTRKMAPIQSRLEWPSIILRLEHAHTAHHTVSGMLTLKCQTVWANRVHFFVDRLQRPPSHRPNEITQPAWIEIGQYY